MTQQPIVRHVIGASIAVLLLPTLGRAQLITPQVAAGIAAPTGPLGEARSPGPALRGAVLVGAPTRRVRLRIAADAAWMPGSQAAASQYASAGDLRVLSVSGSVVLAPRGEGAAAYVLLGGGVQGMRVAGQRNPYGVGGVLHAGVGVRVPLGRVAMHFEVTPQLLLTDYATGEDFSPGTYWPVLVGLSF